MNTRRQLLLLLTAAMIVSSVIIAGCLSANNKNETNQSQQASSGANRDQTLKLMLAKIREVPPATTGSVQSWNETWIDANTVSVTELSGDPSNNTTMVFSNFTLKRFSTVDDATKFVGSETTGYKLDPNGTPDNGPYNDATGHKPSTYAAYFKSSQVRIGQPTTTSYVIQTDNIVMYGENKSHS